MKKIKNWQNSSKSLWYYELNTQTEVPKALSLRERRAEKRCILKIVAQEKQPTQLSSANLMTNGKKWNGKKHFDIVNGEFYWVLKDC